MLSCFCRERFRRMKPVYASCHGCVERRNDDTVKCNSWCQVLPEDQVVKLRCGFWDAACGTAAKDAKMMLDL